jgi:hypothetical protein
MEQNAIVVTQPTGFLAPVINVDNALAAYQAKKDLIDNIMKDKVDYGVIPGTSKPTLLKAGAEKATSFFGLHPVFKDACVIEDWTGDNHGGEPFFYYRRTCELYRNGEIVASVDGSCNSWEKKYRYRTANRKCPVCNQETIIKGKEEYGGGWLCFRNKGGCGAKFKDGDKTIEDQYVGQIKNPDVAETVNTILKMADKRALIAATLIATGMSEYFTQDVEDYVNGEYEEYVPEQATAIRKHVSQQPATVQNNGHKDNAPYTVEEACSFLNSKGKPYGDIDSETLRNMANALANSKSPKPDDGDKITRIQIILDARTKGEIAEPSGVVDTAKELGGQVAA